MTNKLIIAAAIFLLAASVSFAMESHESGDSNGSIEKADMQEKTQVSANAPDNASDSEFIRDFNSVNDPYKQTLFSTGQGKRNESISYYENLTKALEDFMAKYREYRPPEIQSDKQLSIDMENVSGLIAGVKDDVYTGNLSQAHTKLEAVRPIFQKILIRNGLSPISVALVDFHDAMELVLDAANSKEPSKVIEAYPAADQKLRAVEAILNEPGIFAIRANLDAVMNLAKENKASDLPAKAGELKASYVKVYLAMN